VHLASTVAAATRTWTSPGSSTGYRAAYGIERGLPDYIAWLKTQ
jgi:hypothetical protein